MRLQMRLGNLKNLENLTPKNLAPAILVFWERCCPLLRTEFSGNIRTDYRRKTYDLYAKHAKNYGICKSSYRSDEIVKNS